MNVTSLVTIALLAASSAAMSQTTALQSAAPHARAQAQPLEARSVDGVRLAAQTTDWSGGAAGASMARGDTALLSSPMASLGQGVSRDLIAGSEVNATYIGGDDIADEGPQPSSLAMLLAGLGVLAFVAARRGSV